MVSFRRNASSTSAASTKSNNEYIVTYGENTSTEQTSSRDENNTFVDPEFSCEVPMTKEKTELRKPSSFTRTPSLQKNMNRSVSLTAITKNISTTNTTLVAFLQSNKFWKYFTLIQYVVFAVTICFAYTTRRTLKHQQKALDDITSITDTLQDTLFQKEEELFETHEDFTHLTMQLNSIAPGLNKVDVYSSETRQQVTDQFINRHDAQSDRIVDLKHAIQKFNEKELVLKYGEGPYDIEVAVEISGVPKYFTIQTAPTKYAPHAVKTFMDMIEKQVWDDTVLYHQVDHVTVAVPVDMKGVRKDPKDAKGLLFSEYTEDYPHRKFSLGFQGHPGGPEFYINMEDNNGIHGPGGQKYHDVTDDGDSCFGEITHGRDVVRQFAELNAKAQKSRAKVFYSLIKKMTIVRSYNKQRSS